MNTRAPKLGQPSAEGLVGSEVELPRAVVTEIARRRGTGLQAIRSNDVAACGMFDQQVVADLVELVALIAILVRRVRSFAEFQVEHEEPQPKYTLEILLRFGKAEAVDSGSRQTRRASTRSTLADGGRLYTRRHQSCCRSVRHELLPFPNKARRPDSPSDTRDRKKRQRIQPNFVKLLRTFPLSPLTASAGTATSPRSS